MSCRQYSLTQRPKTDVDTCTFHLFLILSMLKHPHIFLFTASVLYYYFYKRTSECLGDPRLYEDSPWLREVFARVRQ